MTFMKFQIGLIANVFLASLAYGQNTITTPLGTLGGTGSEAKGVSGDGTVVVGYSMLPGNTASGSFRWTQSGGMINLGTLGGSSSAANGVSADGVVIVGNSNIAGNAALRAFRWTQAGGMIDLGTLGGTNSQAYGASADGAAVVGLAAITGNAASHAFRWTQAGGMVDLGTLGGTNSQANGVSADGSVVAGFSAITGNVATHAFRWTQGGGMVSLGTLGGIGSLAYGVSADGAVVVGAAAITGNVATHAFRWTQTGGMIDLGTLGGAASAAAATSANGSVVVGYTQTIDGLRAFRWTQATGMQTVDDWLRAGGVAVPVDITITANGTSADGGVVVGGTASGEAFIARVAAVGSGLITLSDVQNSLGAASTGGSMSLSAASTMLNGAHSRPLSRRVAERKKVFWVAGDWGTDDHGSRDGDLGLAEVGLGQNFGRLQLNLSLGRTWAKQDLTLNGRAKTDGAYVMAEALVPLRMDTGDSGVFATFDAYGHWGNSELRRGYLNAGTQDYSRGKPDVDTWGLRARLDWQNEYQVVGADFSPYVDLTYSEAKLDAYTETGGGFPAHFNSRIDRATEIRIGVNTAKPLLGNAHLLGVLEAAHRFEKNGANTSGQMIGLFGFDLAGADNNQDWLRAGIGVEGTIADGTGSLMLNATTKGEVPSAWLAVGWQKAF